MITGMSYLAYSGIGVWDFVTRIVGSELFRLLVSYLFRLTLSRYGI